MGLRGEREGLPSMLATSFAEAAGVSGWSPKMGIGAFEQCEGLSGYVSNGSWCKIPRTGHLQWNTVEVWQVRPTGKSAARWLPPYFWDVPRANIHAVEDIGAVVDWLLERCDFQPDAKSNLAVLHNRNDMTNLFRASNWVSSSNDSIHHLCWNDGPYGPSCPNESGVSNRRSQEVLPSALGR